MSKENEEPGDNRCHHDRLIHDPHPRCDGLIVLKIAQFGVASASIGIKSMNEVPLPYPLGESQFYHVRSSDRKRNRTSRVSDYAT
jgi:hypothetical protein